MNKKAMGKLALFLLTILVVENLLLSGLILLWINRHCKKCQKVRCVERMLNKICWKCYDQAKKKPNSAP